MSAQIDSLTGDILVVDDTQANVRFLVDTLKTAGHSVRPALKGTMALAAIEKKIPDLILLDIRMPEMDGYEVCDRLKQTECTRKIPIIFMSVLDQVEDKVKALRMGGVDYITKPFHVEEVLARVEAHLALQNLRREVEHKNQQLLAALTREQTLSGLIPICSNCKRIRNDKGAWERLEKYFREKSIADFSHGICPDCARSLYPHLCKNVDALNKSSFYPTDEHNSSSDDPNPEDEAKN